MTADFLPGVTQEEAIEAWPGMARLDVQRVPSPAYVVDYALIEKNVQLIDQVQKAAGCKILLAMKGFAMWSSFSLIRRYLSGTTASSLNEAKLGHDEFGKELHVYAPAYRDDEIDDIVRMADHLVFNSFAQWKKYRNRAAGVSCGIRINPQHSEVATALYDPCAPCSRLGVTRANFEASEIEGLEGLHFHTLCELNSDALERTLAAVEKQFGEFIPRMKWINFGGGHHITRPDYDIDRLVRVIQEFKQRYDVQVYLEPGEAIALNTGILVATVLDIIDNTNKIALLDTSATAHMPDVLEMPYRPRIIGGGDAGQYPHTYRLGGLTCLAGDVIGDWSFKRPLQEGDKLVFLDMAHYTMVKNTTFNGVNLPSIVRHNSTTGDTKVVRHFGYVDFKNRLS